MDVVKISIRPDGPNRGIDFNLVNPEGDPYILKGITGLDAEEILIRNTSDNVEDPRRNQPSTLANREIVCLIGLNPNYSSRQSFSDLRDDIYRMTSSSRSSIVTVSLAPADGSIAYVRGFISKIEASHSTKTPEIQVTVTCLEPIFQTVDYVEVLDLDTNVMTVLDSVSTASHGFIMEGVFTSVNDSINGDPFTIHDGEDNILFSTWFGNPDDIGFLVGDEVSINTEVGRKHIKGTRGANTFDIAELVAELSIWPELFPGINVLKVPAGFDVTSFRYKQAFWGV